MDPSLECGDAGKAGQSCELPQLISAVFSIRQIYYLNCLELENVLARNPRLDISFELVESTNLHKAFETQAASRFEGFEIHTDKGYRQVLSV